MKKNGHFLHHFTDSRNIETIRENGLLSLREIENRAVQVKAFGANKLSHDLDRQLGFDADVHLSFTNSHPMQKYARDKGRIIVTKNLKIHPEILLVEGVRYADDICNKNGANILTWEVASKALDWKVIYERLDWRVPEIRARRCIAEKYEILIPNRVPAELIVF